LKNLERPRLETSQRVDISDARATNSAAARQLYKARVPIYPKTVHGPYRRLKWATMAVLLAIYYVGPWIRFPRGPGEPSQAMLVDLARERFYFFSIEIWPQEVYYITGLLILASVGIFLAAALLGRVWCGYACPQTVWTDLFMFVENAIEGDRGARIRLAAAPWSIEKVAKRVAKHGTWIAIGAITGGAWVFFFTDAPTLAHQLVTGSAPVMAYAFIGMLTFTTYAFGGLMREQVCTYMCPWPRIQAAMTDDEALGVLYRTDRGEPRGPLRKGEPRIANGDCIDCNQCVAACPMGIDIRDGSQLECINCALCIDACDDVMIRIGLPRGLIAYDTEANVERRKQGLPTRFRFVRPRTLFYAAIMVFVTTAMCLSLAMRATIGLNVLHDRNPDFVHLSDGSIRNGYTLKVLNRASTERTFSLAFTGVKPRLFRVIGIDQSTSPVSIAVGPDRVRTLRVLVTVPGWELTKAQQPAWFTLSDPKTGEHHGIQSVVISGSER
jgi:cytochrome c oxidase accessory protein FixG